mmetsp:Transcript_17295/g.21846  ORF Transcript_17295/g.21846 Transcript_17295/m.21846 type:complete len:86 (-) Transcript_17295:540-797(-)
MLKLSLLMGSHPGHVKIVEDQRNVNCPLKLSKDIIARPKPHAGLANELKIANLVSDQVFPQSAYRGDSQTVQGRLVMTPPENTVQ